MNLRYMDVSRLIFAPVAGAFFWLRAHIFVGWRLRLTRHYAHNP